MNQMNSSLKSNLAEVPGLVSVDWSEESSSPSIAPHSNRYMDLPVFSLDENMEAASTTVSSGEPNFDEDRLRVELETRISAKLGGTPSLADSFSSVDSDGLPSSSKKSKSMGSCVKLQFL